MINLRMKRIEEVQEEIEKELMQLNDITSIYISEKNNKSIIKVGVKKMTPEITKVIPKEKDGYNIVVEETGELTAF
jgi:hypothetical protein